MVPRVAAVADLRRRCCDKKIINLTQDAAARTTSFSALRIQDPAGSAANIHRLGEPVSDQSADQQDACEYDYI
jgi:hypothetical protein